MGAVKYFAAGGFLISVNLRDLRQKLFSFAAEAKAVKTKAKKLSTLIALIVLILIFYLRRFA